MPQEETQLVPTEAELRQRPVLGPRSWSGPQSVAVAAGSEVPAPLFWRQCQHPHPTATILHGLTSSAPRGARPLKKEKQHEAPRVVYV